MDGFGTANLGIRPFRGSDAAAFVEAARESFESVGKWLPWCHAHYGLAEAESWFSLCEQNRVLGNAYEFGIFSKNGERFLGGVSINQINRDHHFGNIGYWVRNSAQRQGVATEAVVAMADYGFRTLRLSRLEIVVAEENAASRRVAEKVGAVFECIARNRLLIGKKPHAAAVYSLIPERDGA